LTGLPRLEVDLSVLELAGLAGVTVELRLDLADPRLSSPLRTIPFPELAVHDPVE